jgi:adenylate kinase
MMRLLTAFVAIMAVSIASAQPSGPKVIFLVGPPGAGKTTQARFLAQKYDIPAISMADLLKRELAGRKKKDALAPSIASGELLLADSATELIRLRLMRADLTKGFLLDGFPATAAQAKSLDRLLQEQDLPKGVVVVLDAPDDVIRKRMLARRRTDDKPENIDRRIQEFRHQAALLTGWAGQTRVVRVDATARIADVSKQIAAGLEEAWSKQMSQQR